MSKCTWHACQKERAKGFLYCTEHLSIQAAFEELTAEARQPNQAWPADEIHAPDDPCDACGEQPAMPGEIMGMLLCEKCREDLSVQTTLVLDRVKKQLDTLVRVVRQTMPANGQSADNSVLRDEVERAEALLRSIT